MPSNFSISLLAFLDSSRSFYDQTFFKISKSSFGRSWIMLPHTWLGGRNEEKTKEEKIMIRKFGLNNAWWYFLMVPGIPQNCAYSLLAVGYCFHEVSSSPSPVKEVNLHILKVRENKETNTIIPSYSLLVALKHKMVSWTSQEKY